VENLTYRWRGHSKSDRNRYRTQEEIKAWQENDPITRFSRLLVDCKVMAQAEVDELKADYENAIAKAAETALTFADPDPETLEAEVFAP